MQESICLLRIEEGVMLSPKDVPKEVFQFSPVNLGSHQFHIKSRIVASVVNRILHNS